MAGQSEQRFFQVFATTAEKARFHSVNSVIVEPNCADLSFTYTISQYWVTMDTQSSSLLSDLSALTQFGRNVTLRSKLAHISNISVLWAFVSHGCERGFRVLMCVFFFLICRDNGLNSYYSTSKPQSSLQRPHVASFEFCYLERRHKAGCFRTLVEGNIWEGCAQVSYFRPDFLSRSWFRS